MRRVLVGLALVWAVSWAGCTCGGETAVDEGDETPRAHAGGGAHGHEVDEPGEHEERPEAPPARLTHVRGEVLRSGGPTSEGVALEGGETLRVSEGGGADVDLRGGARLTLDPGAEARIAEGAGALVLLAVGGAHALMPPGGTGPRQPLRVATPACSFELAGSGEVYVFADASGAAWLAALAGLTTVTIGEADGRGRPRTTDLVPGRSVLVTSRIGEPTEGPTTLEAARATAGALFVGQAPLDAVRADAEVTSAGARLDEALGRLEAESRRGRELTASHRDAVRAGDQERASGIQRELVAHSTTLFALRQVAASRWERLQATWLARSRLGAVPPDLDPTGSRRDRVTSLLGP